jgi:hypothetical protein
MMLYHGSHFENLEVTPDGEGMIRNFGALFFAGYSQVRFYGDYIYQTEVDESRIFENRDAFGDNYDDACEALRVIMQRYNVAEEHFDLAWRAVVEESIYCGGEDEEEWFEALGMDDGNEGGWLTQEMRIAFVRQIGGFIGCVMNDEVGSIAIFPEFVQLEPAVDPDEEEEEEEEEEEDD